MLINENKEIHFASCKSTRSLMKWYPSFERMVPRTEINIMYKSINIPGDIVKKKIYNYVYFTFDFCTGYLKAQEIMVVSPCLFMQCKRQ